MNRTFFSQKRLFGISIAFIFCAVSLTSFYRLSESPPTWTDEGLIVQTSQNLVGQGVYGFQIAPNTLISPSFISTSYPVTFPIALSFSIFGISLLHARIVMAIYIMLLFVSVFLLFKNKIKEQLIWALLLLGSFPPLYGHGKNVLGEVPGLFFMLTSAFFLRQIEENKEKTVNWVCFGLFFGLAVATKPIFILALPAFVFVFYMLYRGGNISLEKFKILLIFSALPPIIWLLVQFFQTDSWTSVLHYYGNPHSVNILEAVLLNIKDFVSNIRTLFAGGIFILWSMVLGYSYYKKKSVPLYELYLYIFSLFVFVIYFRNPPYYRYFFLAEVLSLVFLPWNLFSIFNDKRWQKNLLRVVLLGLFIFQYHQLFYSSWVANAFESKKTADMEQIIGALTPEKEVFFYQAPEAVIFLKHYNYYQYFSGTITTYFGEENLAHIYMNEDLLVITRGDLFLKETELFAGYHVIKDFNGYVFAEKKSI